MRVQWNRILRWLLAVFRKPQAERFYLLDEPVDALGSGVRDAGAEECLDGGPPRFDGGREGVQFVDVGSGAPAVEHVETVTELVAVRTGPGEGQQRAKLLLRDPLGEALSRRVGVDQGVPHRREGLLG